MQNILQDWNCKNLFTCDTRSKKKKKDVFVLFLKMS